MAKNCMKITKSTIFRAKQWEDMGVGDGHQPMFRVVGEGDPSLYYEFILRSDMSFT